MRDKEKAVSKEERIAKRILAELMKPDTGKALEETREKRRKQKSGEKQTACIVGLYFLPIGRRKQMQEREKVSSIDIKAHLNNLRKNPKFTEEMLKLVESDLQYGLTIAETETYTSKRLDYAQMKVHSACLRNGYPENVRECITKGRADQGSRWQLPLSSMKRVFPLKRWQKSQETAHRQRL